MRVTLEKLLGFEELGSNQFEIIGSKFKILDCFLACLGVGEEEPNQKKKKNCFWTCCPEQNQDPCLVSVQNKKHNPEQKHRRVGFELILALYLYSLGYHMQHSPMTLIDVIYHIDYVLLHCCLHSVTENLILEKSKNILLAFICCFRRKQTFIVLM